MTLENTVLFYASKETPDEVIVDGQTLIPIRTIMRLYETSFGDVQGGYFTEDIKDVCRKFKIPIIKPNGIYNIPCINKKFLDGILYIFRNNHYYYGRIVMISPADQEEAKRDVQSLLRMIEQEVENYCDDNNCHDYGPDYVDEQDDGYDYDKYY